MINLGFNSGNGMPNVRLELAPIDRILEGVAALLTIAAWILALVFYFRLSASGPRLFIAPCVMVALTAALIWSSRAPIRYYNFPVKLNERNYVMQYFIASRFIRILNIIANLMVFFGLFSELESSLNVPSGLFSLFMYIASGLMFLSLVGYYIFAFRNR